MGRTTQGSRKIKLAAALFAFALGACGWAATSRAEQRRRSQPGQAAAVNAGAVYSSRCASCHGEDGDANTDKGRLYGATNFTDRGWWDKQRPTDARLRRVIASGKRGGMPAFGHRLNAAEIAALASYVRGFKGR